MSDRVAKARQEAARAEEDARIRAVAERARANGEARAAAPVTVRRVDPAMMERAANRTGQRDPHERDAPVELRLIRFMQEVGEVTVPFAAGALKIGPQTCRNAMTRLENARPEPKVMVTGEKSDGPGRPSKLYTLTDAADEELAPVEEVVEEPEEEKQTTYGEAVCELESCGETFTRTAPRQQYCTVVCTETAARERRQKRTERPLGEMRPCKREDCRNDFYPQQPRQEYCSDECRHLADRASKTRAQRAQRQARREQRVEASNGNTPHADPRDRYLDLLFELADKEEGEGRDGILDRIERMVGVTNGASHDD